MGHGLSPAEDRGQENEALRDLWALPMKTLLWRVEKGHNALGGALQGGVPMLRFFPVPPS